MTRPVKIRLLVSVGGDHRAEVRGDAGDVLVVDRDTAQKWCDGERAERVIEREVPVEKTTGLAMATSPSRRGPHRGIV